jgi:hypothetical protein
VEGSGVGRGAWRAHAIQGLGNHSSVCLQPAFISFQVRGDAVTHTHSLSLSSLSVNIAHVRNVSSP